MYHIAINGQIVVPADNFYSNTVEAVAPTATVEAMLAHKAAYAAKVKAEDLALVAALKAAQAKA